MRRHFHADADKIFVLHAGTAASAAIMGGGGGSEGALGGGTGTTTGSRPCRRSCSVTF